MLGRGMLVTDQEMQSIAFFSLKENLLTILKDLYKVLKADLQREPSSFLLPSSNSICMILSTLGFLDWMGSKFCPGSFPLRLQS